MTTTSLLQSRDISQETRSYSSLSKTLNEASLGDWEDILDELSDKSLIEDVIKSRREYREGKSIPQSKLLEKIK